MQTIQNPNPPKRVPLIDELRGLSILLMVTYHALYDVVAIFGLDFPFFFSWTMGTMRDIVASSFILFSGMVCRYSRNNLKRGIVCSLSAVLLSLITMLFLPSQLIAFGILHFMGIMMMAFALLQKILDRLNPKWGILLFTVLFLITFNLPAGFLGFKEFFYLKIPADFYSSSFLFPLGLPSGSFFSSDYYPLIPWGFLYFVGCYLGIYLKAGIFPSFFYKSHFKILNIIGRKSLIIYLLHQPILFGLFSLLFWLL